MRAAERPRQPESATSPDAPGRPGRNGGSRRWTIGLLVAGGLLVALLLAFFVSPFASSSPDGLEKVAADKAIDRDERDHALAGGPLADYSVRGVNDARLSTGLAGVVGVAVTFAVGGGLFLVVRRRDRCSDRRGDDAGAPVAAATGTGT